MGVSNIEMSTAAASQEAAPAAGAEVAAPHAVRLGDYLVPERVVTLRGVSKTRAIEQLIDAVAKTHPEIDRRRLAEAISEREEIISTAVGHGIAIPHGRMPLKERFLLAVGRSKEGIDYEAPDDEPVRVVILLVADENAVEFLQVLAEIAVLFRDAESVERVVRARSRAEVVRFFASRQAEAPAEKAQPAPGQRKVTRSLVNSALELYRAHRASAIFLYADALTKRTQLLRLIRESKVIVVTRKPGRFVRYTDRLGGIVRLPGPAANRTAPVRLSILLALARGLIKTKDLIVCLSGENESDVLDTLLVLDVAREHELVVSPEKISLPADLDPEVLERVIDIAADLAGEGREGRAVGTIFIVGDTTEVLKHCKQLVINPFLGYDEANRNLLDPVMEETIKEFSAIDGAFIIRGDGVIHSAGTYLRPPRAGDALPGGLGARHEAAAAMTASTDAIAVVLSQSTGKISIFRHGSLVTMLDRPVMTDGGSRLQLTSA
jgi:DNA integrity scanning protein DisA with diadenylate cyclase activity/mannitol/fructose-specific phosphotransferase system IIA component (Ntr-type)